MSVELYLQKYSQGAAASFSKESIREVLMGYSVKESPTSWEVGFDADQPDTFYLGSQESIESLMISKPGISINLYEFLIKILKSDNFILYWPGGTHPLVGQAETTAHIPSEMINSLGLPIIANKGQEILNNIKV